VSIAVGKRRIDQVDAQFNRAAKRQQRLIVGAAEPLLAANAPGAIADVANLEVSPAKFPVSHTLTA